MKKLLFALLATSSLLAAQTASDTPGAAAVPALPPLPKAPEPVEPILRLQLFLDSKLFCPGKVDGRPGDFTNKALKRYQAANGLPETEVEAHSLDLSSIAELFTTYTVREENLKFVGELPGKPSLQSKKKYLPYDSVLEFLTERFHTSPELITWLNRPAKMSALKPGDAVKVPNVVQPFEIELLQPIPSLPEVPEFKTSRVIKIDTREKLLAVFEGEKMLLSLPITPGSGYLATPPGTWTILGITQMPTFRWDEGVLNYGVRTSNAYELPIGPNNPVGVMWVGLNKPGIGIHGTAHGQTIGRSSSHGCMRTANWDVVRLVKHISKGMPVIIEGPAPIPRPPRPAATALDSAPKPQTQTTPAAPAKKWFQFWKR
jgi:lipoprotein-anchoring transpeptidase ErfK/SrfK